MFMKTLWAMAVSAMVMTPGAVAEAAGTEYANPHLLTTAEKLASTIERENGVVSMGAVNELVIIDVRPMDAFREGHIPGAGQIEPDAVADPASPVGGALRPIEEIAEMLGTLGVTASSEVVLYDDKGGFHASRMFWLLEYMGHRKVKLLDGGIHAWTKAGLDLQKGRARTVAKAQFTPAMTPRRHATADYILERRDALRTIVIDVRPANMFAEGHIPWARSIPWKGNLNEDGTMKPAGALQAHFEAQGVTPEQNIVVHCQNGLASSHSYFALRLLGYPEVRTYHRSWAEWGAADDLPKAGI